MRIALLTIFYKPDFTDIKNFIEISKSFQGRYCFINSILTQNEIKLLTSNNIEILGNGTNIGLSRAYNYTFKECLKNNFDLCFITDQDSKFESIVIEKFIISSINMFVSDKYLGITSMSLFSENKYIKDTKEDFSYEKFVINSGSLISCKIWREIGMYDENLFIDMVDYDFCYRLKKLGFKIIKYKIFTFKHSIGKVNKYLFNLIEYNSYNHQRHYKIIRDRLYFSSKKYFKKTPLNKLKLLIEIYAKLLKHLLLILFFENNKYLCLKAIVKAMIEFLRKN